MNSIFAIKPYRFGSVWVFDDASRGLKAEPFVGDINVMIDRLAAMVGSDDVTLMFSAGQFPDVHITLEKMQPGGDLESGGTWYRCPEFGLHGWLCPVLFQFFEAAPKTIFVRVARNNPVEGQSAAEAAYKEWHRHNPGPEWADLLETVRAHWRRIAGAAIHTFTAGKK